MNIEHALDKYRVITEKSLVVYTAIIGEVDELKEPSGGEGDVEYVCFTSNPNLKSNLWKVVYVDFIYRDPRRTAKLFKFFPNILFPASHVTVWIDATLKIKSNLKDLVDEKHLGNLFSCYKHPSRICIYDEAKTCTTKKKDDVNIIREQMLSYRSEGYPSNNKLIAGGLLIRNNDEQVNKLMKLWHDEVDAYSVRDLLSFNYIAWNEGFSYFELEGNIFSNNCVEWLPHNKIITYNANGEIVNSFTDYIIDKYNKLKLWKKNNACR